jgi:methylated-DNA-[protein]-cysteine S-methyltransferase
MNEIERILRHGPLVADAGTRAELAARRLAAHAAAASLADVAYAPVDSPLGPLLVAATPRGLVRIAYPDQEIDDVLEDLAARVSPRVVEAPAALDVARRELEEYFAGGRDRFGLRLDWSLVGPFARRVLGAAVRIPYGRVSTYREVAEDAGSPRGYRAAGNALGGNPMPIVVPCHRVLHAGGGLGGYTGGLDRKRFLLALEGSLEG